MRAWVRWLAPIAVLALAALLRFWALGRPGTLVFDELYYVRDAISQLANGFPTVWPDDDPSMAGERATAFTSDPSNAVHPPLGKWLIGIGILVFGPESGWGWRSAAALAGVATVGIVMRLGWLMSRSLVIACLAGLLLAIDGVHVVLSRVGLLDGFLACFVALGALFVWRDQLAHAARLGGGGGGGGGGEGSAARIPIWWWRPWLIAAAVAFGAAAAVKWSGLYPLACFLVFITVRDLLARLRLREPGALWRATAQAGATALIALPTAALTYLASWTGWIVTAGGYTRAPGVPWPVSLLTYHREMLAWHSTLSAPHPYQAHPLSWPLALRPTGMYEQHWTEGCPFTECVAAVSPLPNALVTLGGVIALGALAWWAVRALWRGRQLGAVPSAAPQPALPLPFAVAAGFVLVGYLSGWLPWVATVSRSAVFQFYAVVLTPFSALALALCIGVLCRIGPGFAPGAGSGLALRPLAPEALLGRRLAACVFLAVAVAVALFFFPIWSGQPVAEWFWRAHIWLPGWN
ncbi:phospholipid carrier-dependent glycosyltransferase [Leucobacter chromiireducens]|uniref:phospholipid carrier-dependent glycosyltransferase n=1 Tax=Leucobacter chromiireducens TaxID=283877 RepID=UPI001F156E67|nr:phospholipid carrier-dependent glycosyltransferase [Leucobacter chromiireducens]